jgi:hypothetical protein
MKFYPILPAVQAQSAQHVVEVGVQFEITLKGFISLVSRLSRRFITKVNINLVTFSLTFLLL